MKKLSTRLLLLPLCLSVQNINTQTVAQQIESDVEKAANRVSSIWQNMEKMRDNVEEMFEDFGKRFQEEITDLQNLAEKTWDNITTSDKEVKPLKISISEKDADVVTISVSGITAPTEGDGFSANISYDANEKPNRLVIANNGQEISIVHKPKFNHLGVSVTQERTVKRTDEEGNIVAQHQSAVHKSYGQNIAAEIMLDEPVIDYIAEEQQLVISIAKVAPTAKKKTVNVNVR